MKNYLCKFAALALFAVALAGAAVAQTYTHTLRANIPFEFYAGDKLMPAGEYTVGINMNSRMVSIGDRATGGSAMILGLPDENWREDRTVLIFKLAGDVYALRELKGPEESLSFNARAPHVLTAGQSQKSESAIVNAEGK